METTPQLTQKNNQWYDNWRYVQTYRQFVYTYTENNGHSVTKPLWYYCGVLRMSEDVTKLLDVLQRGDYFARKLAISGLSAIDYIGEDYLKILQYWKYAEHFTDVIVVSPTLLSRDAEFKGFKMDCSNALWRIEHDDDEQKRQIDASRANKKGSTMFVGESKQVDLEKLTPKQIKSKHEVLTWFAEFDPKALADFEEKYMNKPQPTKQTIRKPHQFVMDFTNNKPSVKPNTVQSVQTIPKKPLGILAKRTKRN